MIAQLLEELACLLELLGPGALSEVAADDQEVRPERVDVVRNGLDQSLVVSSKMKVRQMDDAGHASINMRARQLVSVRDRQVLAKRRTGLQQCRNGQKPGPSSSEVQQHQQLGIHAKSLGALLFEEIGNVGARDEMDVDIFMFIAAARPNSTQTMGADKGEPLRQHAR